MEIKISYNGVVARCKALQTKTVIEIKISYSLVVVLFHSRGIKTLQSGCLILSTDVLVFFMSI